LSGFFGEARTGCGLPAFWHLVRVREVQVALSRERQTVRQQLTPRRNSCSKAPASDGCSAVLVKEGQARHLLNPYGMNVLTICGGCPADHRQPLETLMKFLPVLLLTALPLAAAIAADGQPTDAQIDTAFTKADTDKNGTVSLQEAKKFGITTKMFEKANPDKDGSLNKKEFAAAVSYQFTAADPDKDGTLDWKEAQKAGIKNKRVFDASDPDRDGTLDLAEYLMALAAQAKSNP
jgi:EF-hand domain pair